MVNKIKKARNTINKLLKSSEATFSTPVEISFIDDFIAGGVNLSHTTLNKTQIKWSYKPNYSSWGIDGITIDVPSQQISVSGEEFENLESFEFSLMLDSVNVEYYSKYRLDDQIFPSQLIYQDGQWRLEF